ncbi:MAG: hypothetical protein ACLS3M_06410 [Collinsella sp.]
MVKLPVIVYRRHDKLDVIQDAFLLQRGSSRAGGREVGGGHIAPVCSRPSAAARGRGGDLRQALGEARRCRQPAEQIAIRTGGADELGDADLMSRACPIRYIITVEALAEGWDCPFAYVLATVANKNSRVSVEQLVGRILRQPYARRSAARALNISYVLTSSADFNDTIDQVVAGLNGSGFSKRDVSQSTLAPPAPLAPPVADPLFTGDGPAPTGRRRLVRASRSRSGTTADAGGAPL